jgi:hypothetical protein
VRKYHCGLPAKPKLCAPFTRALMRADRAVGIAEESVLRKAVSGACASSRAITSTIGPRRVLHGNTQNVTANVTSFDVGGHMSLRAALCSRPHRRKVVPQRFPEPGPARPPFRSALIKAPFESGRSCRRMRIRPITQ